jgi:hypothetical protein
MGEEIMASTPSLLTDPLSAKLSASVPPDVKNISEITKIKKINGIRIFVSPEWKWKVIQKVSLELSAPDFSKAMKIASQLPEAKPYAKQLPSFIKSVVFCVINS